MTTKLPKAMSIGESTFLLHCRAFGLEPEREFRFHPTRKWRFDFAFPHFRIAVEIEGGIWVNGAHTRGQHFESDAEKYNQAVLMGWRVLRYSTRMATQGVAIDDVKLAIGSTEAV